MVGPGAVGLNTCNEWFVLEGKGMSIGQRKASWHLWSHDHDSIAVVVFSGAVSSLRVLKGLPGGGSLWPARARSCGSWTLIW